MSTLPAPLRRQLENAAKAARKIASAGARKALEALAVHEPDPYQHMNEAHRGLRRKLRAQARQLGDGDSRLNPGTYEIGHLVEKLAYDQWHRLLFARFLLENNLLISPEHAVSVSLDDCEELAPSLDLKDAWAVAARFAAVELPEIFRADDPAGGVELPVEDRKGLIQLVTGLPVEVFTASDSLGWCYQFWQAERKDQVNLAGNKIGADELPSVTQLFTEDYMVDFLLDNTLGAWWAGKQLALIRQLSTLSTEAELRQAVALPGCPWKYLRFIQGKDGKWTPAAGTFAGWPKTAKELKCLDPCMGSGHFVVAMFERLVDLRLAEENLDEAAAVAAVIRDNLFGLEIDPRCTQIGAFNLALAAWRRVGHCKLPAMNLACSGLAPNSQRDDWINLATLMNTGSPLKGERDLLGVHGEPMLLDARLAVGMAKLYDLFQKAPVLGSLINPRAGEGDLLVAAFHELQPLLEKALAQEAKDDTAHEMAVTARGLAKAAEILAGKFTLVATNVPYLGRGKQDDVLKDYCERIHPDVKADLATCFVERCFDFCAVGASTVLVTPQNWLFLGTYKKLRERLLDESELNCAVRLGPNAFRDMNWWAATTALFSMSRRRPRPDAHFVGYDTADVHEPEDKAIALSTTPPVMLLQSAQLQNPDARLSLKEGDNLPLLSDYADSYVGLQNGDSSRFIIQFWEIPKRSVVWEFFQLTCDETTHFHGREGMLRWENGGGELVNSDGAFIKGREAWNKRGVAIRHMRHLPATFYDGSLYDQSSAVILPKKEGHLAAIWAFCSSPQFHDSVRQLDQALKVTNATLVKVPFDLAHWQKLAAEKYPHGLPKPFSSDPTQWLFNGHPAGADQPLHVAVARLLGYQWPRQTGSSFPDCPALGPDGLEKLADDDGIVPISPAKGEGPAAERLRELLASAYGKDWNATRQEALLAQVDYAGASLEDWLRNGFFEQHCALFHHRPFIWHVWDGLKNGFSVLVNYHKLTHAHLEKLTYSYLGDWIRRQQAAVEAGEAGSDAKLQAAKTLQGHLKLILEGEPPYDIFVRWKPLSKQAIGWHPDLNDGVRMNIRPFMAKDIPGGKKGAGILRFKPNIKWDKDRGKEPVREKKEFPWFWQGGDFTGDRVNDVHLTKEQKARK